MTAIDPRLLRHYNDELLYLRRRAVEFSEDHRQVAGRLGIDAPTDPDPHVERLLEGVAYLNARVQLRLDDQFPAFTQYLLDALYPHYLAPTPAMAIMEYTPREGDEALAKGIVHPRGSAIQAWLEGDSHARVQFRTGQDVTLWPIRVAAVEYLPTRAAVASATGAAQGAAGLRIRLAATSPAPLSALAIDTLPLFIDGGQDTPNLLFQQMIDDCVGVRICAPERGRRDAWSVRAGPVEAMGFAADEALLPGDARSFRGYRLLSEYFAMPEKFRFVRLTGLSSGFAKADQELDIVLLFDAPVDALVGTASSDTIKLFAAPAINLFERRFDRVVVDRRRHEHLVIPDRVGVLDHEVYRLNSVTGYARGDAHGSPALPLYARRAQRGVKPLYYALHRRLRRLSELETRQRRESDYIGTETWISLSSPESPMLAQGIAELGITGLVTNRALATRLRPGQANLRIMVDEAQGVGDIRILRGPTRPRPPLGISDSAWRIVSHLAPGHQGFVQDDGAPDLLADHLSLYLQDEAPALRREIQGITGLRAETVTRRSTDQARLAFQRGRKLVMSLASGSYDAGSAYLFTSVVAQFLSEFATINSFVECEVHADNGLKWGVGAMLRAPSDDLNALFADAAADPTAWEFFALLRSVEQLADAPRIGTALDPGDEPIDLAHEPSVTFPRSTISSVELDRRRPRVVSLHLGLTGPMGPMPLHMTEMALFERTAKGTKPLGDFLDLVSARMLQGFYRAWASGDPCAQADRPADDDFAGFLGATSGATSLRFVSAAERGPHEENGFGDWRRLAYGGHLSGLRSASAVSDLLSHVLERPVRLEECVGRWREIAPDAKTRIGRRGAHHRLGKGATLGGRFFAVDWDIALCVVARSMDDLERLLVGGEIHAVLVEAATAILPPHIDWSARIEIDEAAIAPARLGSARLGMTAWVAPRGRRQTRNDVRLTSRAGHHQRPQRGRA